MDKVTYRGLFPFPVPTLPVWDGSSRVRFPSGSFGIDWGAWTLPIYTDYPFAPGTLSVCGQGTEYPINLGPDLDTAMKLYWRFKEFELSGFTTGDGVKKRGILDIGTGDVTPFTVKELVCNKASGFNLSIIKYPFYGGGTAGDVVVSSVAANGGGLVKGDDDNYWGQFVADVNYIYHTRATVLSSAHATYGMSGYVTVDPTPAGSPVIVGTIKISGLTATDLNINLYLGAGDFGGNVIAVDDVMGTTPKLYYGVSEISTFTFPDGLTVDFNKFYTYDGRYDATTGIAV